MKLNQKGHTELILSIEHKSSCEKIVFRLINNYKSSEYLDGNCKLAWDRLLVKYAQKSITAIFIKVQEGIWKQ